MFPKKISFFRLFFYWVCFFIVGIIFVSFSSSESSGDFCSVSSIISTLIAPFWETLIFMIIPWKLFGMKGAGFGLIIWALLHLVGGDIFIFIYILIVSVFYFKCLQIGRWRFIILVHFLVNVLSLLSCL